MNKSVPNPASPDPHVLATAVQRNCDIADARFAREYTMCIYLLKMREYFRWERGIPFGASLPRDELGHWVTEREQHWHDLEQAEFEPVMVDNECFEPFDSSGINRRLQQHDLVYSAGLGWAVRPQFFLARLDRVEMRGGLRVIVAGAELAREITAPPAMAQGKTIFVRHESLRRMIWEKLEEWQWRSLDTPMGRAAAHYPFETDLEGALTRMTEAETESVILHELGELRAGELLGSGWERLLLEIAHGRQEYFIRAVRDHLADTLLLLPALIERENAASLHFYFANFTGVRREIHPALLNAYDRWLKDGDWDRLAETVSAGERHWRAAADHLLALHNEHGARLGPRLEQHLPDLYL